MRACEATHWAYASTQRVAAGMLSGAAAVYLGAQMRQGPWTDFSFSPGSLA